MFSSFFHFWLYPTPLISYIAVPRFLFCTNPAIPESNGNNLCCYEQANHLRTLDFLIYPIRFIRNATKPGAG